MISILVTAFKEPQLKKSLDSIIDQKIKEQFEIIVVAPDKEAEELVLSYNLKNLRYFKDPGKGKAYALNLILLKLKSDIIIATDGDVILGKDSISNLLLLFKDDSVGAVSGRPVALNKKDKMVGYFSNLLLDAGAHKIRKELDDKNKFIECSGYLFAFRNILKSFPLDVAEDSIIPYLIWKKGYKIRYSENSLVYVKYPDDLSDFIHQRKRSGVGSHAHLTRYGKNFPQVKTFWNEIYKGFGWALSYPKNVKEFYWTLILFFVKGYIWGSYYFDEIILRKPYADNWERIDSTKNF